MKRKAKQWLQRNLSPATKLRLKRWAIRARGAGSELLEQIFDLPKRVKAKAGGSEHYRFKSINYPGKPWDPQYSPRPRNPSKALPAEPIVSIIIPVFNKADFTFGCLRALIEEIDLNEAEIIVIDNASTDHTGDLLARFTDLLKVIRNETNLGFVDACNLGAAAARGKYLVFLNNDTIIQPGWLKSLIETIEGNNHVGAVGSLFLYPDGSIQEAGGIIWSSGEPLHYGWGKSTLESRYLFAREVDYCSGASLLIRKNLFDELGGFDRRFGPAYYEDADLCMGVRFLGFKVIYQPASRVVHYEGATAGRDVGSGMKRYQVINASKFRDKWADVLQRDHQPNDRRNLERAANRDRRSAVIVFDDRVPTPDRDAGSARMFTILKSLARHYRTVFTYLSDAPTGEYEAALWHEGIETAHIADYPRLLKQRSFQAAIISRPHVAQAVLRSIRRRARGLKIIFDMVDAHYLRFALEYKLTGDPDTGHQAERYKKIEVELARASDLIWCNSSADKDAVAAEAPEVPIEVIPTIHELHKRTRPFAERKDLIFIGNFNHSPNRDALQFFVREIFPLVRVELPEVKFDVIGSNAPAEIQALASDSVKLHGYVPEIDALFNEARVFVAPLRFGAGVKGKIGEALAFGVPVVTTDIGAEGMGFQNGQQAMVRNDPQSFANAVIEIYRDPDLWEHLSTNGQDHIAAFFSPVVVEKIILRSIDG